LFGQSPPVGRYITVFHNITVGVAPVSITIPLEVGSQTTYIAVFFSMNVPVAPVAILNQTVSHKKLSIIISATQSKLLLRVEAPISRLGHL
jgi:hypothetical protein